MAELILYFSRAGENYFGGSIRSIEKGNTEIVAEKVAAITGGELFKVIPRKPYSEKYEECTAQAKKDQMLRAKPAVVSMPEHMEQYDTVTVLFPNYWGTMPRHMFTVLEALDLEGKTVRPICTHEGSGMGSSEKDLAKLCKGAELKKGLAIQGSSVGQCDALLERWLENNS